MSHKEYNVGYRDSHGNLKMFYRTSTHHAQAVKRLKKSPYAFEWECDSDGQNGRNVAYPTFLVEREISDWKEPE